MAPARPVRYDNHHVLAAAQFRILSREQPCCGKSGAATNLVGVGKRPSNSVPVFGQQIGMALRDVPFPLVAPLDLAFKVWARKTGHSSSFNFFGAHLSESVLLESIRDLTDTLGCAIFLCTMTLRQLMEAFPTNDSCKEFLMQRRWPDGKVKCPRCDKSETVYKLKTQAWKWECSNKACRKGNAYRFSIIAGTIFENTNYPLKTWFEVLWQMLNSKKGVSAMQIQRQIGCSSYHTAWYMCHRLRAGMADPEFVKLMGIVEVDETYIGGKEGNKHRDKRLGKAGAAAAKTPVIGAISRKGNVVCQMIDGIGFDTLEGFARKTVSDKCNLVATDEHSGYRHLGRDGFRHETVNHAREEYVRGQVHTQSIESFWSLLKRGILGTYHNVSKKYLPLYLNEFTYRFNNRKNQDIFGQAIAGC